MDCKICGIQLSVETEDSLCEACWVTRNSLQRLTKSQFIKLCEEAQTKHILEMIHAARDE